MYLSIGQAARLLGVTPATVRNWADTGLLPCTRTVGRHRRFLREDVAELARAVTGGTDLAARAARERELEALAQASIAVASHLDQTEVLAEIAKHMTSLCRCHLCEVDEYHPEQQLLRTLAEYDRSGRRMSQVEDFYLRDYPFTRRILDEQIIAVVNADDPRADAAEVALLHRDARASSLFVPLVFRGRAVGLLTATDRERSRRYSAQELRLCRALAGHAAVALRNAELYRKASHADDEMDALRRITEAFSTMIGASVEIPPSPGSLPALSEAIRSAFGALSCVLTVDGHTVGASAERLEDGADGHRHARHEYQANVLTAAKDASGRRLEITLTRSEPSGPGQAELLDLVASLAAKITGPHV